MKRHLRRPLSDLTNPVRDSEQGLDLRQVYDYKAVSDVGFRPLGSPLKSPAIPEAPNPRDPDRD